MAARKDLPLATLQEAVLRLGTNRAAARELGLSTSTVSRRLRGVNGDNAPVATPAINGVNLGQPDGLSSEPSEDFIELPVIHRFYDEPVHYVYPLGDIHKGAPAHAEDRWREWLAYLEATPEASLLIPGDLLNCAIPGSKSDTFGELMTVGAGRRELRAELALLAGQGRIDAIGRGNHEARVYRATGDCPALDLADVLDVPYFPAAAIIIYHIGVVDYICYVRHGTGKSPGSLPALMKSGQIAKADFYITGHTHNEEFVRVRHFEIEQGRLVSKRRAFLSAGSFVNYEEYAADRGYVPGEIGAPRIRLNGERFDVHYSF